ncbi:MAG: LppA family lipoprotein, partial [Pseudonocardiaceae bacterium]
LMRRLVIALTCAVLAAGCTFGGSEQENMDEKLATLAQRPTIEDIRATYEDMQARLRDRLSAEVGLQQWINDQNLSGAGCGDDIDGQSLTLDSWTSKGNLPDTRWDDAVRIVTGVTGEYGFGPPQAIVDRPSDHEITGFDPYGAKYLFGTAANTVLMVSTGCHLPADAHPGSR